jgi:hypothetical protein
VDDAHPPETVNDGSALQSRSDPAVEELRDILFSHYRRRIAELERELDELERRLADEDALAETVSPIIGDAISRKIRANREEMVEALYPIIAQTVVRAVSEAIRDLARTIDARMRTTLNVKAIWRQLVARLKGVSGPEMALRESLPFSVDEVFLIHRESGLLLCHISRHLDASADSDLISGMLTAIRDFARDAFGRGTVGDLDEIQYGEQRILIQSAQHAYLAVVVDGTEPPGFRAQIRERVVEISQAHRPILRDYDGNRERLAAVEQSLRPLLTTTEPAETSPT